MLQSLLELDGQILLWIQENLRNDILTPIMKGITILGNSGILWVIIAALLLFFKKTRNIGIMCVMGILGSLLVNNLVLKNLVGRTRPYDMVEGLTRLIEAQTDPSFPSGHTGVSFAVAVILFKETPVKYGIPALIIAALIAFSRLYLGVHFLSDVLAGMINGIWIALLCCWFYHKNEERFFKKM